MKITNKIKRKMVKFFYKHPRIYTLLIFIIGIAIGCSYDGRGQLGEFYFKIGKQLYYIGAMQ